MSENKTIDAEIVPKKDPLEGGIVKSPTPADLLQIAVSKDADIDKLAKLMELQMLWDANEAKKAYTQAMSKFRSRCPEIVRNRTVAFGQTHYTHADLSGAISQIKGLLTECGLSHSWRTETANGTVSVTCILTHVDGHSEQTSMSCQPDNTGNKNAIQAIGSATTYLQRYTLFAILGLASADDDDGGKPNEAPEPLSRARKAQQAREPGPQPESQPQPKPAPSSGNGAEDKAKQDFALVCNTIAMDHGIINGLGKLEATEYKNLLAQAKSLGGVDTIEDARKWAQDNVKGMVKDEGGVRWIA